MGTTTSPAAEPPVAAARSAAAHASAPAAAGGRTAIPKGHVDGPQPTRPTSPPPPPRVHERGDPPRRGRRACPVVDRGRRRREGPLARRVVAVARLPYRDPIVTPSASRPGPARSCSSGTAGP